jgi:hypothetical protein
MLLRRSAHYTEMMKHLWVFAATAVLASACSDAIPTAPTDGLLTTDSASYTAIPSGYNSAEVRVVTLLRNSSDAPITLDRCYPTTPYPIFGVGLVSPSNSEGAAWNPNWACVGHDSPIVIAAHSTRTDTLRLRAPNSADGRTGRPFGVFSGRFRIEIGAFRSNEFEIKLPAEGLVPYVTRDLTPAIQTDSLLFHLKDNGQWYSAPALHVSIYNPRPDTTFIVNCNGDLGFALEKQNGSDWQAVWGSVNPACLGPAIVIPPGGHYDAAVDITGGKYKTNIVPQYSTAYVPGVYRMVFANMVTSFTSNPLKVGPSIPIEFRRSNPFALVVQP